jgi:hypothetical protein
MTGPARHYIMTMASPMPFLAPPRQHPPPFFKVVAIAFFAGIRIPNLACFLPHREGVT